MLLEKQYKDIFNILARNYPKLFIKNKPLLLKVGIYHDISTDIKVKIGRTKLRKFLRTYCTKEEYDNLHKEGAARYDSNGKKYGIVTKKQAKSYEKMRVGNVSIKDRFEEIFYFVINFL